MMILGHLGVAVMVAVVWQVVFWVGWEAIRSLSVWRAERVRRGR